jgi:hypothetical protein
MFCAAFCFLNSRSVLALAAVVSGPHRISIYLRPVTDGELISPRDDLYNNGSIRHYVATSLWLGPGTAINQGAKRLKSIEYSFFELTPLL